MQIECPSHPVRFSYSASISISLIIFSFSFFTFVVSFWNLNTVSYRVNGIDFEEIKVDLSKRQHLSPEFQGNQSIVDFYFRGKQYYTLSRL